jgi:pyruvate-formate lyase-activating enzyme
MSKEKMEKIKRLIECVVPITACTLRCPYCYITHGKVYDRKLVKFLYDADFFGKAISRKRLGGICLINFCAEGETMLPPEMPSYIKAALEQGHFVHVVTNGTVSERFEEVSDFPTEYFERLFFKFSFHYLELKKREGLIDEFFNNINKMRAKGASFTLELTPSDEVEHCIDDIIKLSKEYVGAACHVTVARNERIPEFPILTDHSRETYEKIWSVFDSELFKYKLSVFGEKRKEFCYAGSWSAYLNIFTGAFSQCNVSYYNQNIYKNIEEPIQFLTIGNNCGRMHCHNAHSFLGLGVIPELNTPTYAEMRNRICADGSEWLQPRVKYFFSSKLSESNREYSSFKKLKINIIIGMLRIIKKVIGMIRRCLTRIQKK